LNYKLVQKTYYSTIGLTVVCAKYINCAQTIVYNFFIFGN